jgi:hypothetical protein
MSVVFGSILKGAEDSMLDALALVVALPSRGLIFVQGFRIAWLHFEYSLIALCYMKTSAGTIRCSLSMQCSL